MGVKKTAAEKAAAKAERKKKLAAKKAARLAAKALKDGKAPPPPPDAAKSTNEAGGGAVDKLAGVSNLPSLNHVHITGVLSSREESVDVSPVAIRSRVILPPHIARS